jgi:prephenate dehydrogenase
MKQLRLIAPAVGRDPLMKTVAIVGVGLIGGSFGLALRKAGFPDRFWASVPRAASIRRSNAAPSIAAYRSKKPPALCDLLFLAQPISGILETCGNSIRWCGPSAGDGRGQHQAGDRAEARRLAARCAFLGGHPMAGKEQRGARRMRMQSTDARRAGGIRARRGVGGAVAADDVKDTVQEKGQTT